MVIKFEGIVNKCLFNKEDYKIYSMIVDGQKFTDLHINKYGTITCVGNFQELEYDLKYYITAEEVIDKKYGYTYKVRNISLKKPDTLEGCKNFLMNILTYNQVNTLLSVYPNIVQKVIDDDLSDIDLNKLPGIKEKVFARIKNKIIQNFVIYDLVNEFKQILDYPILIKLYNKYNSVDKLKAELQSDPYKCLTQISRIGFITADNIIKKLYNECTQMKENGETPPITFEDNFLESKSRCQSCIQYCLEQNEEQGNTKMNVRELIENTKKLAFESMRNFKEAISDENLFIINKSDATCSLVYTYNDELYIANKIINGLKNPNIWDCDIEKYKSIDGYDLTDEQLSIIDKLCKNNICILQGNAGTGKSYTTTTIIKMVDDLGKTYKLMSPTGKASQVLKNYTGREASTIHRALHYDGTSFSINLLEKLTEDLIILDETSMCDVSLFKHLVESIDFTKTKLLLIGDSAQIPSVSKGNVYVDLIASKLIPTVNLTKVFRYKEGGISKVATDIRNMEYYLTSKDSVQVYGVQKDYVFFNLEPDEAMLKIIALYKTLLYKGEKPQNISVLSCMNKGNYGCDKLNKLLQPIANTTVAIVNNKLENDSTLNPKDYYLEQGDNKYYKNDLIINTINDYNPSIVNSVENDSDIFIANGEIGTIVNITKEGAEVMFHNNYYLFPKDRFAGVKLAYALSIYKMQGSQSNTIILFTPKSHIYMLNNNLLYTGVTRARKQIYHFADNKTICMALKKKAEFIRQTNLLSLLVNPPIDINDKCKTLETNEIQYILNHKKTMPDLSNSIEENDYNLQNNYPYNEELPF